MRRSGPALIGLLLLASPAAAATQTELESTERELKSTEAEQSALSARHEKLQSELQELQSALVEISAAVRKSEIELADSQDKLSILTGQITARTDELKSQQTRLTGLVRASISLSHTPPEAMVMMPGDVTQTMKAARALKIASESVRELTQSLSLQLEELSAMQQKVGTLKNQLEERKKKLTAEEKSLTEKLAQRRDLQKQLGQRRSELAAKMAQLAKKTKDLRELVSSVESERVKREEKDQEGLTEQEKEAAPTPQEKVGKGASFAASKGKLRPPALGRVVQRYGASQGKNATSRGITLQTRDGSGVVAPFAGEVVFTGPFMAYGDMVILHHQGGYHSLLAGLKKIDVSVGQFLLEGEPIGAMGEGSANTRLYVELRQNNQPIDPAGWISGLK